MLFCLGDISVPLFSPFSSLFFTILPAHSFEPCVVEFFQHYVYFLFYLKLRSRGKGKTGGSGPRCHSDKWKPDLGETRYMLL